MWNLLVPSLNYNASDGWDGCDVYVQRMDDARNTKKIYQANLHHKRPKGRPKDRRKYDVENDIWELLIGDKQRRIGLDGGEQPRRRVSSLDSGATEEKEIPFNKGVHI
jgi:hypothetical protein